MSSSELRLDISTKISDIVSKYEETTKDMNFTVLLMVRHDSYVLVVSLYS